MKKILIFLFLILCQISNAQEIGIPNLPRVEFQDTIYHGVFSPSVHIELNDESAWDRCVWKNENIQQFMCGPSIVMRWCKIKQSRLYVDRIFAISKESKGIVYDEDLTECLDIKHETEYAGYFVVLIDNDHDREGNYLMFKFENGFLVKKSIISYIDLCNLCKTDTDLEHDLLKNNWLNWRVNR